jgi:hypothetical protein
MNQSRTLGSIWEDFRTGLPATKIGDDIRLQACWPAVSRALLELY